MVSKKAQSTLEKQASLIVPAWCVPAIEARFGKRFANMRIRTGGESNISTLFYEVEAGDVNYLVDAEGGDFQFEVDQIVKTLLAVGIPLIWQYGDFNSTRCVCFGALTQINMTGELTEHGFLFRGANMTKLERMLKKEGYEIKSPKEAMKYHWHALMRIFFEQCHPMLAGPVTASQDLFKTLMEPEDDLYILDTPRVIEAIQMLSPSTYSEHFMAMLWAIDNKIPDRLIAALEESDSDAFALDIAQELIIYALNQSFSTELSIKMIDDSYDLLYRMEMDPQDDIDPGDLFHSVSTPSAETLKYLIEREDFVRDMASVAPMLISIVGSLHNENGAGDETVQVLMEHAHRLMQSQAEQRHA